MSLARLAWTCRVAMLFGIVGVFGPWRVAGPVSLDGFEGPHNGWFVLVFALFALAGVGSLARGGWLGIIDVAGCGAIMVFISVRNLVDDGGVFDGHAGWGIWLTIGASIVVLTTAGVAVVNRLPTGSRPASPRPSP